MQQPRGSLERSATAPGGRTLSLSGDAGRPGCRGSFYSTPLMGVSGRMNAIFPHVVISSKNPGPQYRPQSTRALILGTPRTTDLYKQPYWGTLLRARTLRYGVAPIRGKRRQLRLIGSSQGCFCLYIGPIRPRQHTDPAKPWYLVSPLNVLGPGTRMSEPYVYVAFWTLSIGVPELFGGRLIEGLRTLTKGLRLDLRKTPNRRLASREGVLRGPHNLLLAGMVFLFPRSYRCFCLGEQHHC